MAEKEGSPLHRELGITRRDLMRRGAVVGGTLLWATPVIQSLTPAAFAHDLSPAAFYCCHCFNANGSRSAVTRSTGACLQVERSGQFKDGHKGNAQHCQSHCEERGFDSSSFHKGPNPFACSPRHPSQGGGCSVH